MSHTTILDSPVLGTSSYSPLLEDDVVPAEEVVVAGVVVVAVPAGAVLLYSFSSVLTEPFSIYKVPVLKL